jgi:signal transduction histidine kinase
VSATVGLGADDAAAAVDALLDNVFAHTPDGTGYAISLAVEDEVVRLSVEDTGAGIDDARTVLPRGQTSARSTGLGLDIARRAAEAAGGRLTISRSQLGGARVTLELPRPGYRLEF